MTQELLKYIPKEFKSLVVDIYLGTEKEFDKVTNKWSFPLYIEWENGEISIFQNKTFARNCLKEFHTPNEYSLNP